MDANNSDTETGDFGTMSIDQATDQLAGLLANSEPTATAEPESEEQEEVEAEAVEADAETEADDVAPETLEADAEDDESETEYEAAETEAEQVEEPDYIEIDGNRVTLDEVGNGYLRQADYTKKTQELAEQRKAFEAEQASIAAEREHLKQMLEFAAQQQDQTSTEDLAELARADPLAYITKKAELDEANAKAEAARAEQDRLNQIEMAQQQAQMAEYVEQQKNALLEAIPELATDKGAQYRSDILTYMEGVGFSKNELSNLYDSRAVVLADKARKYDELMSKGKTAPKKARKAPKVVKPGTQTSKKAKASNTRKQVVARARKSGSVNDAVQALLAR